MVQFILVRPGSTDYDQQARIQGTLDIPLSDAGRSEVAATAEKLCAYLPAVIYSCAGNPAEDAAALLGKALRLKPKKLDRLQNVNLGLWQGMLVEEVRHKQPKVYKQWQEHPEMVHPPEGEMIAEVVERLDDCLDKIVRKHRSGAVVLVASEPLASIVRHRIEGKPLGDLWRASNAGQIDVLNLEADFAADKSKSAAKTENGTPKSNGDPRLIYYRGSIVERH